MKINDIHNIAYYNIQIEFYSSNILNTKTSVIERKVSINTLVL